MFFGVFKRGDQQYYKEEITGEIRGICEENGENREGNRYKDLKVFYLIFLCFLRFFDFLNFS